MIDFVLMVVFVGFVFDVLVGCCFCSSVMSVSIMVIFIRSNVVKWVIFCVDGMFMGLVVLCVELDGCGVG